MVVATITRRSFRSETARTAFDYLSFELGKGGNEVLIGSDYLGLPENAEGKVKKIAEEGLAKISFS